MWGKSSNFWNTMPMLELSLGRSVFASPTEMPSTVISPFWKGSSAFTHLISVDLPLPEGPHTTTTSPLATSVEQSTSTWKVPYHLLTFFIEIIGRWRSYPEVSSPRYSSHRRSRSKPPPRTYTSLLGGSRDSRPWRP